MNPPRLNRYPRVWCLVVCILCFHPMATGGPVGCETWLERLDSERGEAHALRLSSPLSETDTIVAFECLLSARGNSKPARFSGATRPDVSQVLPPASVEIAALYYISYLYTGEWQHASGVALRNSRGQINPPHAVSKAYSGYKKWLPRVKQIGLSGARLKGLDPLGGTGLAWYGN